MNKFLVLIAIAAGSWFWFGGGNFGAGSAEAVDANGNPIVMVFTFDKCGANCNKVIKTLEKRGVPFEEHGVNLANTNDENTALWKKMGKGGFPYTVSGSKKVAGYSKTRLVSLLGENFGEEYLTKSEKRYFSKHFNDDGSPKIVMYGAEWCGYCKKLKKEFKAESIDYVEIDVEKSGEQKEMSKVMEIKGYPSTWVGYSRVNGTTLSAVKETMDES